LNQTVNVVQVHVSDPTQRSNISFRNNDSGSPDGINRNEKRLEAHSNMKLSFVLIACTVFATQTYQYVSAAKVLTLRGAVCFDAAITPIGSGEKNPVRAVLPTSFKTFPLPATTAVKVLAEEKRGAVSAQSIEIGVTISKAAWDTFEEVTAVRSKGLLNILGTLNLIYPESNRPWEAKITMKTLNSGDTFP
jgi:hypothetical protein